MYGVRCINVVFNINFGLDRVYLTFKVIVHGFVCKRNLNLSFVIFTLKP